MFLLPHLIVCDRVTGQRLHCISPIVDCFIKLVVHKFSLRMKLTRLPLLERISNNDHIISFVKS